MNTLKVFIATAVIFLFSSMLGGCGNVTTVSQGSKANFEAFIVRHSAAPRATLETYKHDVEMTYRVETDGDKVKVHLRLSNPSARPVASVRGWLGYNPDALQGVRVEVTHSPFFLTAPLENDFDAEKGLVMIGRGNNEPITDLYIDVATVVFKRLSYQTAMITAHDYQPGSDGHFSANILAEGEPYNVLSKPNNPVLILQ